MCLSRQGASIDMQHDLPETPLRLDLRWPQVKLRNWPFEVIKDIIVNAKKWSSTLLGTSKSVKNTVLGRNGSFSDLTSGGRILNFLLSGLHRRFIVNFGDDVVLHISTRKQVNNNKKLTGATNKVRAKRIRQLIVLIELRWLVINVRNGLGSATRVNKHMKCNITDDKVIWTMATRHATIRLLSLRGRRLPCPQSRRLNFTGIP